MVNALDEESCMLTLDYAYYHCACCLVQVLVLTFAGHTKNFRLAHAFGLFAFVMDYALGYMTTGSRSVAYPNLAETLDKGWNSGDEPLGPVGDFLFFIWFDYSAFGLLLWILDVEQNVRVGIEKGLQSMLCHVLNLNFVTVFNLVFVPFQFWSAPWISPLLHIDSRQLLLQRSSSKLTYALILFFSIVLLRHVAKLQWLRDILPVLVSGFCCGLVHHAALFFFGMRGYSDISSLIITLLTEWPALSAGVAVVRALGLRFISTFFPFLKSSVSIGNKVFIIMMWLLLILLLYPHIAAIDDKDAMGYLIPLIPGEKMQTVGTAYLRFRTCVIPNYTPSVFLASKINCWHEDSEGSKNNGSDMLVMASAAKSGAVLSARIVAEIGSTCGVCVASGERSLPGIPGPVEELPVYEGQLLHAIINMRTWPYYVHKMGYDLNQLPSRRNLDDVLKSIGSNIQLSTRKFRDRRSGSIRCVTFVRDPLSRLRSLYTYSRSGGEHWFRYKSGLMHELSDPSLSIQQSVELFWRLFGRSYLQQSHDFMMLNLDLGCIPIKMESFSSNFSSTVVQILRVYGVNDAAVPILLNRLSSSDVSSKTADERKRDAHVTDNKFSLSFVQEVKSQLMNMPDVRSMVVSQRIQLGYS